jgi:methionyl-tRNA formyltransferase
MANLHAGQKAGSVLRTESSELALVTGDGLLIIDRLTPAGKREMTGHEFMAGHPIV